MGDGAIGGRGGRSDAADVRRTAHRFRLVSFAGEAPQALAVDGEIVRWRERLAVTYRLHDPHGSLAMPTPSASPQRCDGLWQATCAELFLARPGQTAYREFNLSPSGDWNVYQLQDYRQGLRPDPAWTALPLTRHDSQGMVQLQLNTCLPPDLSETPVIEVAITAVLQGRDGACGYWALRHPGPEADFHRRDGFGLRI
jgi:hypothetical protein